MKPFFCSLAALLALATGAALAGEAHWPQFRGPGSCGVADEAIFPDHWSATENIAWKADLPGRGWSSPVVWSQRIFLTTAVSREELESPRKGLYIGGERPTPKSIQEWWVYCLDLRSGKTLWKQKVHEGPPPGPIHIKNSYASETPVTDGERVYAYFGNLGLWCFDMEGHELWSKRFEPHKTRLGWGTASSPALHGERLYIVNDNEEQSWLTALDKRTGKEIWRVQRDEKSNWSTPFVWANRQRTEIVTAGTGKVRSYDLEGKELWSLHGMSGITIATPFAGDMAEGAGEGELLYISSGYIGSILRPIYAIRPGGSGDITVGHDQAAGRFVAWYNWTSAPYNPSTLLYQGRLYVLLDRGMLSAYDAKTGKVLFERQRIADGGNFTASPWAAGGKIYCMNEDGVTFVFKAGDSFELLHANRLAEEEMALACPAIAGDKLLIRTSTGLYCIAGGAGAGTTKPTR